MPVPDRLEDRVREAQVEDVLDRHLPEEVVDAVELRLVDERVQALVQLARRGEVVAERLLDDDASVLGEARVREPADDRREERGRDLEVEDRQLLAFDLGRDLSVDGGVLEIAVDVREALREAVEHLLVERLAGGDDRVPRALDQLLERPVVERDADDRAVEEPARFESVQRAERHHAGEVARDAEDDEHVGAAARRRFARVRGRGLTRPRRRVIRPTRWCVSSLPAQSTIAFARSSFVGRSARCTVRHANCAFRPFIVFPPSICTTAAWRPIAAMVPLSR